MLNIISPLGCKKYNTDISAATLSAITDKVIPLVKEWQSRPLDDVYCIVWMDAMFYKVKDEGGMLHAV